jgi:cobalt/nickel transport system permease protein
MGANIFNMGILTALVGFGLYRSATKASARGKLMVAGVAAWLSVMAGALSASLQLWLSGTVSLRIVMPALLGVHALIGVGEALITAGALAFLLKTRPDLLSDAEVSDHGGRRWIAAGVAITLLTAILAPLASAYPDGLERVAENLGFIDAGVNAPYQLFPNYAIPFLGGTPISTILAVLIGAAAAGIVVVLLVHLLRRSPDRTPRASRQ